MITTIVKALVRAWIVLRDHAFDGEEELSEQTTYLCVNIHHKGVEGNKNHNGRTTVVLFCIAFY